MENLLLWLQNWYESQCDGDWEHQYGVKIGTLDNPGWTVDISLEGTEMEDRAFIDMRRDISENDWIICRVRDRVFQASGGPRNLEDILRVFKDWVEGGHP